MKTNHVFFELTKWGRHDLEWNPDILFRKARNRCWWDLEDRCPFVGVRQSHWMEMSRSYE